MHFFKMLKLSQISNTTLNIIVIYRQHKLVTQRRQIITLTLTLTVLTVHEICTKFELFILSQ
jgi:hypothetical protein